MTYLSSHFDSAKTYYIMVTAAELIIVISAHIYFFLFATSVDVYFMLGAML